MEWIKLKNVAKYPTGKLNSNAANEGGSFPFFTCSHEVYWINKYAYDGEYVLLGGNNATGDFPIFYYNGKFEAYQRTYLIQPLDKKSFSTRYLYYAIGEKLSLMQKNAAGTATKFLTKPILDNITIPKYDFPTQQKIASILSTYDTLIENNTKRVRLLEQMAENLYKEWFVRFRFPGHENVEMENGLPKGWKRDTLKSLGITLDTGKRPSGGIDSSAKDGVPSLGAEAIKELASFDYSSVRYIPNDFYKSMKRGHNTGNDILVYKDGAYIGKVTLFRDEFPFKSYAINEHVFFLSPTDKQYHDYLYFTLHQPEMFVMMQNLNRNAAQPGLSKKDMEGIKISIPSKDVVTLFNSKIEVILQEIFSLAKQNRNLTRQRDLLLPRLMSGKLEVQP